MRDHESTQLKNAPARIPQKHAPGFDPWVGTGFCFVIKFTQICVDLSAADYAQVKLAWPAYGGRSRAAIQASARYAASITASRPTTVRLPP